MSNKFNIFLLDNPCRKVELAEPQYKWRTHQEHSGCDRSVQRGTSAINSSWYLEEEDTTDFEDYHKVTNILKELAITINMKLVE